MNIMIQNNYHLHLQSFLKKDLMKRIRIKEMEQDEEIKCQKNKVNKFICQMMKKLIENILKEIYNNPLE